jgi:hypothetical protein
MLPKDINAKVQGQPDQGIGCDMVDVQWVPGRIPDAGQRRGDQEQREPHAQQEEEQVFRTVTDCVQTSSAGRERHTRRQQRCSDDARTLQSPKKKGGCAASKWIALSVL